MHKENGGRTIAHQGYGGYGRALVLGGEGALALQHFKAWLHRTHRDAIRTQCRCSAYIHCIEAPWALTVNVLHRIAGSVGDSVNIAWHIMLRVAVAAAQRDTVRLVILHFMKCDSTDYKFSVVKPL